MRVRREVQCCRTRGPAPTRPAVEQEVLSGLAFRSRRSVRSDKADRARASALTPRAPSRNRRFHSAPSPCRPRPVRRSVRDGAEHPELGSPLAARPRVDRKTVTSSLATVLIPFECARDSVRLAGKVPAGRSEDSWQGAQGERAAYAAGSPVDREGSCGALGNRSRGASSATDPSSRQPRLLSGR